MKRVMAAMMLAIGLTSGGQLKHESASHVSASHVVLPNSELIGCKASGCSHVWLVDAADSQALYPRNISIDIDDEGVLGVVARYDRSTAIDDIRASINKRYGKWVFPKDDAGPATLWRVEPEKVAIQLSEHDDGTKEVIYLSARAWLVKRGKAKP